MVETSMLAAVSGLLFLLTTTTGLDRYLGYILPIPILVAAARRGSSAAWWTAAVTACLLAVLLGPLRAVDYSLSHGVSSSVLGALWARPGMRWRVSIPVAAVVKASCQMASFGVASVTLGQNLFELALSAVGMLLDKAGLVLGSSASAALSQRVLVVIMVVMLLLNCVLYCCLSHVLYYIILSGMRYNVPPPPKWLQKAIYPQQPPAAA